MISTVWNPFTTGPFWTVMVSSPEVAVIVYVAADVVSWTGPPSARSRGEPPPKPSAQYVVPAGPITALGSRAWPLLLPTAVDHFWVPFGFTAYAVNADLQYFVPAPSTTGDELLLPDRLGAKFQ